MAVKVYTRKLDDETEQRRFLQESAAAGRLSNHSGVVTVHDAGILPDGEPYLVMELCPGGSLTRWLKPENKPDEELVRRVGVRIADALATAHAAGVLHCDVKPANVLVDAYGDAGLADFGLAAVGEPEDGLEHAAWHLSPAYAPPEVLRGQPATEAGDVFSLAATLYALLAGRPPREVPSDAPTSGELAELADRPIPQLVDVNWRLAGVLGTALSDDPTARPTAAAFRDELAALKLTSAARRARAVPAAVRQHSRARLTGVAASAGALAGLKGGSTVAGSRPGRRAAARLVPLAIVIALLASGGIVTAWAFGRPPASSAVGSTDQAAVQTSDPAAVQSSNPSTEQTHAEHSSASAAPVESSTPSPVRSDSTEAKASSPPKAESSPASSVTAAAATELLAGCRERVRAGDEVVRQAKVGIGHWADHVQAQTDAFAGKLSPKGMKARFKRTRLAGPADVSRYRAAVNVRSGARGACTVPDAAPGGIKAALTDCSKRAEVQAPVLAAAAAGMADWESHLADMRRSKAGHVKHPQNVWLRTWRAAPPNIEAWKKALADMDAPRC